MALVSLHFLIVVGFLLPFGLQTFNAAYGKKTEKNSSIHMCNVRQVLLNENDKKEAGRLVNKLGNF